MKPGGYRFPRRLSFCPSVCLSVRLSVRQSTWCPSSRFSELFSVVLWDLDLKFGIWICLDIIQIKFDFGCVWPTFTWVIALCKKSVFRTFLCHLSTYWVEISYMNLSWHHTGQDRLWSRLTYFYMSYCPLQKFRFPDYSLSSFDILSWNFIYEFVFAAYRSRSTFVAFDLLLHELLPFVKIPFSGHFFVIFRHIELKFHIWICLDIIQVKIDFGRVWPTFTGVIALC